MSQKTLGSMTFEWEKKTSAFVGPIPKKFGETIAKFCGCEKYSTHDLYCPLFIKAGGYCTCGAADDNPCPRHSGYTTAVAGMLYYATKHNSHSVESLVEQLLSTLNMKDIYFLITQGLAHPEWMTNPDTTFFKEGCVCNSCENYVASCHKKFTTFVKHIFDGKPVWPLPTTLYDEKVTNQVKLTTDKPFPSVFASSGKITYAGANLNSAVSSPVKPANSVKVKEGDQIMLCVGKGVQELVLPEGCQIVVVHR